MKRVQDARNMEKFHEPSGKLLWNFNEACKFFVEISLTPGIWLKCEKVLWKFCETCLKLVNTSR